MATVVTDSLIAYWALEEASGQRNDSHGANHLTDNNTVTMVAGKLGNAAEFVRANSESLTIADNEALSMGDIDMTVACWVNLTSKPGVMGIVSKSRSGAREWILRYDSSADRLSFRVRNTANTTNTDCPANALGSPALSTWYFVVCWHDSVNNTVNIQVNGGTVNTVSSYTGGVLDGDGEFAIGRYEASNFLDGLVDGVSVWKRVLTAQERADLYNGGSGLEYPFGAGGGGVQPLGVGLQIGIGL